jgi:DNA-binding transcriptional ArsR family regulator
MSHARVSDAEAGVTLDRLFDVLAQSARRRILRTLAERGVGTGPALDRAALASDAEDGESSEIELVHVHLPKLDDAGLVEWDREAGTVTRGPNFDRVRPVVELLDEHGEALPGDWP